MGLAELATGEWVVNRSDSDCNRLFIQACAQAGIERPASRVHRDRRAGPSGDRVALVRRLALPLMPVDRLVVVSPKARTFTRAVSLLGPADTSSQPRLVFMRLLERERLAVAGRTTTRWPEAPSAVPTSAGCTA